MGLRWPAAMNHNKTSFFFLKEISFPDSGIVREQETKTIRWQTNTLL